MLSWLKGKEAPTVVTFLFDGDPKPNTPSATGVQREESREALHDEFVRTFCHRPGENFVATLQRDGATRLIDWLSPKRGEAEAMAFVSLAVDATRKGVPFWDQPAIVGFRHGGAPKRGTTNALSVLAQYCGKRIKLYFETLGGETRALEFET